MSEEREKSFFGDVDKGSMYPGWTQQEHIRELKESIRRTESAIERDMVPQGERGKWKENLKRDKERLEKIEETRPKLSGAEEDELAQMVEEVGERISESMFTRGEMQKGTADAHEEVHRALDPCIEMPEKLVKMTKVNVVEKKDKASGKVKLLASRDEASRAWKIARKYFGESSNPEVLRKD